MRKYDIIFDFEDGKWLIEKAHKIVNQIEEFLFEWQEEFRRKPEIDSIVMGIGVYQHIKFHPTFNASFGNIEILDLVFDCYADWSVNSNYLEINLK